MTLARDFENGAAEILKQFGKDVTLRAITAGTYDPATNTAATVTTDYTCRAYIGAYRDWLVDGFTILKADRKCTIQGKGLAVAPLVGWQVIAADGTFAIMDVARKEIDDTSIVWVCQIRHGAQ